MSFSSDRPLQANQLPLSIDFPEDNNELITTLSSSYKQTVDAMNTKEGSLYLLEELASYNQYFPTSVSSNSSSSLILRQGYRMTYDLVDLNGGPIPVGTTTINIPANQIINGILNPTRLRGAATITGPQYVSLHSSRSDAVFNNTVPAAQTIVVTNNYPTAMSQAYLIVEYLKT